MRTRSCGCKLLRCCCIHYDAACVAVPFIDYIGIGYVHWKCALYMVFFPKIYVLQSVLLIIAAATQQADAALECDELNGYYFLADSKCRANDINTVFDGGKLDDCNDDGWVSFSFLLPY